MSELRSEEEEYVVPVDTDRLGVKLAEMADYVKARVFGQDRAIEHALRRLAIYEAGLNDPTKPVGAMIFAGGTGVGKTFTAKIIAEAWIGGVDKKGRSPAVIVECGNLIEHHNIQSLIGAPPSYVGYGDSPILGSGIRRYAIDALIEKYYKESIERALRRLDAQTYLWLKATLENLIADHHGAKSVIVFDEIEKAHPLIWNVLLNILEEGKITLADGTVTDFSNTIFILTTNIGSREIQRLIGGRTLGFKTPELKAKKSNDLDEDIYRQTKAALEKEFPAELLGRLSHEIIVFRTLEYQHYLSILNVFLGEVIAQFQKRNAGSLPLTIVYKDDFKKMLLRDGIDPRYGARTLRTVVQRYVLFPIAAAMTNGELKPGDQIMFTLGSDGRPVLLRTERGNLAETSEFRTREEKAPLDLEKILISWGFLPPKTSKSNPPPAQNPPLPLDLPTSPKPAPEPKPKPKPKPEPEPEPEEDKPVP